MGTINSSKAKLTPVGKLPRIDGCKVAFDTEGSGLSRFTDKPFLLSMSVEGKKNVAVRWTPDLALWIKQEFPNAKKLIAHNTKFDLHQFIQGGVPMSAIRRMDTYCTMVSEVLVDEHQLSYSLDNLGKAHLDMEKDSTELFEKLAARFGGEPTAKEQMGNLHRAPAIWSVPYAIQDVRMTLALHDRQQPLLEEQDLSRVHRLEMAVLKTIVEVERRGILIDNKALARAKREIAKIIIQAETEIYDMVGFELNVRSGKQMLRGFEKLNLPVKLNGKGNPTFDKYALEPIHHPFAKAVLDLRSYRQVRDTFIEGLGQYIRDDDKVYTTINQTFGENEYGVRSTGRFSSSAPNMQQATKRKKEVAALVRAIFRAYVGHTWLSGDWSQFEFRMFAHYTNYKPLLQKYKKDPYTDFHQAVADMVNIERDPSAKRVNLGLVFGMGEGKMARELNLPYTTEYRSRFGKRITAEQARELKGTKEWLKPGPEAQALFDQYHSKFPSVKPFLKQTSNLAKSRGYVRTFFGRRIRFPKGAFYKAAGLVYQGSSADFMKRAFVDLNEELRGVAQLLLPVHDEFNASAPKENSKKTKKIMKEVMEDITELRVPIKADIGTGPNWWKACQ